jgi:hypothetical protein
VLEANLDAIDQEEAREIRLGSHRRDTNVTRKNILADIDAALKDYGMASFIHLSIIAAVL